MNGIAIAVLVSETGQSESGCPLEMTNQTENIVKMWNIESVIFRLSSMK